MDTLPFMSLPTSSKLGDSTSVLKPAVSTTMSTTTTTTTATAPPPALWSDKAAAYRAEVAEQYPKEYLLPTSSLPPASVLDVTGFPHQSGLLTPEELAITETTSIADLLAKLASGKLTAVQVTTAFIKRACIAQQLVSILIGLCHT